MVNYQKSKVYSIRSRTGDEIYIGSTVRPISKRFSQHKSDHEQWSKDNNKNTCTSYKLFEKYDIADLYYELIVECPCDNVEQLRKIEGEYIRKYMKEGVCCNKLIAGRSVDEYILEIREERLKYHKQYRIKNTDRMKEQDRKRYIKNKKSVTCECGIIVNKQSLTKHQKSKKHLKLLNQK
jgi:hypothetical protein